ncbi:hypothetical protein KKP04_14320 [Rhodomicrobium sp. Az07]|uniref:hypothetical protein n=1 Tax=Rhodomicrobium sp. Az07 TaxID=2839034 RepID=UPI001BEA0DE6|nr:hypothetical protein [Rhodomicrobium sp. Az07]MBT3072034.1 hypothetical protein [Rhodomicrobium sp. Az07]
MIKRPKLSLPSSTAYVDAEDEREIKLATYDVLLPCRRFRISYKVAVVGRVSLTAEFLLRLLKSADGLDEGSAASFFGFDRRDMSFVLSEVESLGYVQRRDGKLWLTIAGLNLFPDGSEKPEIFEIESVNESVAFDLLALAPERFQFIEDYETSLPELKISDSVQLSDASTRIPTAFRRFYFEIMIAKGRNGSYGNKRSIYSIDDVDAGDRFLVPVTIAVKASGACPWMGEADLSEWRSDQELQDRIQVGDAASAFVEGLQVSRRGSDPDAYRILTKVAPEFLKDFIRADGLAVERYYRDVLGRRGQMRSDRLTIPILGALTNKENVERLLDALSYASKPPAPLSQFVWLKPRVPCWGATRALPETLKRLKSLILHDDNDEEASAVCLATGQLDQYLNKMFDEVFQTGNPQFPDALEILLIPGLVAAAVVHAPIKVSAGHAVPLGLLSIDPQVVARVQDMLINGLGAYNIADSRRYDELMLALSIPFPPQNRAENLIQNNASPPFSGSES